MLTSTRRQHTQNAPQVPPGSSPSGPYALHGSVRYRVRSGCHRFSQTHTCGHLACRSKPVGAGRAVWPVLLVLYVLQDGLNCARPHAADTGKDRSGFHLHTIWWGLLTSNCDDTQHDRIFLLRRLLQLLHRIIHYGAILLDWQELASRPARFNAALCTLALWCRMPGHGRGGEQEP